VSDADSTRSEIPVGDILRQSRESQGIRLEDAALVTRIGQNYLSALEAGLYATLPSPAYTRGFLRAYATYLGLSGDEIVAQYEKSLTPSPPPADPKIVAIQQAAESAVTTPLRKGRWLVPVILLTLVVVAAFIVEDRSTVREIPPLPAPLKEAVQSPAPLLPVRSSVRKSPPETLKQNDMIVETSGRMAAEPVSEGLVLKLKVNQDCSLNITIDGAVSQQYDLKAGDLIEWKGERVFVLDLGNGGGVEAELNGKPQKSFGEAGKPAHVVLQAAATGQK
jgi:transcriptional regulator with XRE-family HTH domain